MTYSDYTPGFQNIGDYIQSLAAAQYLPPKPLYLNREFLNTYDGNPVQLIMNGWFMHNPENFPPSNNINPLFVSFHVAKQYRERLLTKEVIDYLKKHGPIGCRDKSTLKYLTEKNIPCYFSGCLTLTLDLSYKNNEETRDNTVYIVDPYIQWSHSLPIICEIVKISIKKYRLIKIISKKLKKEHCEIILPKIYQNRLGLWIYATMIYNTYSRLIDEGVLTHAEYLTHIINTETFTTDSSRFHHADELLKRYSKASLVITSRLHCGLPCVAMGTPCVFTTSETLRSEGRFDGLEELLHIIAYDDKTKGFTCDQLIRDTNIRKITMDTKIDPKRNHLDLREKLISICNKFVHKEPECTDKD